MDKPTLILAQLLISFLMALAMSGIMSAMAMGLSVEWLSMWPRQFVTAWPIAFVLSLLATRIAFPMAVRLRRLARGTVEPGAR